MTHVSHVDAVYVHQDVSFLEIFATRPVQDSLDLLAIGAVRDGETETHSTFGYLHRQEFHLVGNGRWIAIDSSIAIFITCIFSNKKRKPSLNIRHSTNQFSHPFSLSVRLFSKLEWNYLPQLSDVFICFKTLFFFFRFSPSNR